MISVAMATYNGEKYLREQIDSILSQTYKDFELVISDDCSTDSTFETLNEYARKDKRIKIFKNNGIHGCAKNFENVLNHCNGDYVAYSDQDDVWTEDHLEHLLNIIGNASLAVANAEVVDSSLNRLNFFWGEKFFISEKKLNNNLFLHLIFLNFTQGAASLFKKDLLDFLPFPNSLFHDHWSSMVACLKDGIVFSEKSILKYRQHSNNTLGVMPVKSIKQKIKNIKLNQISRKENFNSALILYQKIKNQLSEEKQKEIENQIKIAEKIIFKKSFREFKKNYNTIFWDENKSKFWTRSFMYCL